MEGVIWTSRRWMRTHVFIGDCRFGTCCLLLAGFCTAAACPVEASFHLMQIEQVIGGVNGDTSAQAIQLRIRFPGDGALQYARLRAWDANGENPIMLIDFVADVPSPGIGDRVLVASAEFAGHMDHAIAVDFAMTNLIPASYLAAGRVTYEGDDGKIYWSLSFGGSAYTGETTGEPTNDADEEFGPPFDGPLPSTGLEALQFQGTAVDSSTTNLDDYALTPGPAVFTNFAGDSATVGSCPRPIDPQVGTDLKDFALFEGCFGETSPFTDPCCESADLDNGAVIGLADYDLFHDAFVGP